VWRACGRGKEIVLQRLKVRKKTEGENGAFGFLFVRKVNISDLA
tara:strand:+ start:11746 stop:11877 length:132 start_codon:yes stop_codon:yes gene_type:complete